MRCLIVGYGSIGQRHSGLLSKLGISVAVYSRRVINFSTSYDNLEYAIDHFNPDFIIIATETVTHVDVINKLHFIGFSGIILVEKPLGKDYLESITYDKRKILVVYNMRFHPITTFLKSNVNFDDIISSNFYVGQYLPFWRVNSHYQESYSASSLMGGGVLRDLSHELDLILHFMGDWIDVISKGGHFSKLNIASDDVYQILLNTHKCSLVSLECNYLDYISQRKYIFNTNKSTILADFINNKVTINNESVSFDCDYYTSYINMYKAFISKSFDQFCSFDEGNNVLKLVNACEDSVIHKKFILNL